MAEPSFPPGIGVVSQEDVAESYGGPALASNYFIAQPYGNSLRVAFLEKYDLSKPAAFRTAITIQSADIQTLINLLAMYMPKTTSPAERDDA